MAHPGYKAIIKIDGTPTRISDEAATVTSDLPANTKYVITNDTKRILDRSKPVVVKVGNVTANANSYEIDYLFGTITFSTSAVRVVTVSGHFIPVISVAGGTQYSISINSEALEDTSFTETSSESGWRTYIYGLQSASVSITRIDDLTKNFKNRLSSREVVLLELSMSGGLSIMRGWFIIDKASSKGELNSVEMEELNFTLSGNALSSLSLRKT
jgi:predicted secreted protein